MRVFYQHKLEWLTSIAPQRAHSDGVVSHYSNRFLLVEGSFCAGTRAGMAHAHLLLTWFDANDNATSLTSLPPALKILEARASETANFA